MTLAELGAWIAIRISTYGGKSRLMAEEKFGWGQHDFMVAGDGRVKVGTLEKTLRRMGYRLVLSVEKLSEAERRPGDWNITCDECGRNEPVDGEPPAGWVTLPGLKHRCPDCAQARKMLENARKADELEAKLTAGLADGTLDLKKVLAGVRIKNIG